MILPLSSYHYQNDVDEKDLINLISGRERKRKQKSK